LALVAFGGAGPLHACTLADALDMAVVIVPARAGVLSAVGILTADEQRHLVQTWPTPTDHTGLAAARQALAARVKALLNGDLTVGLAGGRAEIEVSTMVDCRYAGQSHELTVPDVDAFAAEHQRRNGYARANSVVEVIAVRAVARRRSPLGPGDLPGVERAGATGPAVVAEADCTIWIPEGWVARPGRGGALVLRRVGGGGG
ncbi:MAG TPA: hydantoinase/oxoprolinase family protein, partial [Acidimicrobiales bacterium]